MLIQMPLIRKYNPSENPARTKLAASTYPSTQMWIMEQKVIVRAGVREVQVPRVMPSKRPWF